MSLIGSEILAGASGSGVSAYEIEQSLRFNSADSAYLSRTHSASNQKLWTWSGWVKRGKIGTSGYLFYTRWASGNSQGGIFFAGDTLRYFARVSGSDKADLYTTSVFRDPSAWYHVVAVLDAANTSFKFYVNNVEQPLTTVTSVQNADHAINHPEEHNLGNEPTQSGYFDGYMSEVHFVDGAALDPTDFGEYDDNGVWRPINVSGLTYGTNGFYLDFSNSSALGEDQAGSNDFTASGFTTSGTGTDVMSDTPTTNWCTLNPLWKGRTRPNLAAFSDGNLTATYANGGNNLGAATVLLSSGKWYYESVMTGASDPISGWGDPEGLTGADAPGYNTTSIGINVAGDWKHNSATLASTGTSYTTGDIVQIALDLENNKIYYGKNGTWTQSGDPAANSGGQSLPSGVQNIPIAPLFRYSNSAAGLTLNFGQRAFAYTPPTGFKALNTANLPAPDIADGSQYFDISLYTGDQTSNVSVTDLAFQPDFVWGKNRSSNSNHWVFDAVRGTTKMLAPDIDAIEETQSGITSFDTNGFTLGTWIGSSKTDDDYVAWNWLAANGTETNTDGTATNTVTVSANPSAGFSIVTYSGQTSNFTWGHGLGVPPSMVIIKRRNTIAGWSVYHKSLGATKRLQMDQSGGAETMSYFQNTDPTDTVFSVTTNGGVGGDGSNYVAYCFAEVEGYSKFGIYNANQNSDGPFVYCGFKPAWVLIKAVNIDQEWVLADNARNSTSGNPVDRFLYPQDSSSEGGGNDLDFLSNGFKVRVSGAGVNYLSGYSYLFAAFAEHPFGGEGVSPATAR